MISREKIAVTGGMCFEAVSISENCLDDPTKFAEFAEFSWFVCLIALFILVGWRVTF